MLTLNPGDGWSRGSYAWLLMAKRQFEESLVEIKRALALDPLMPLYYAWSVGLHVTAGRYDEALADFAKCREIEPNFGLAYFHAGAAYYFKGLIDEAAGTLQRGRELGILPGWGQEFLLLCHLKKGDRAKAEATLAAMIEERKKIKVSPVSLAWSSAALGDFDGAIQWLETGIRERDTLIPFIHIYAELMIPALARDPRFGEILDRLQLPRN